MKIVIFDTSEQLDEYGANIFVNTVKQNANAVLGLATGSTPIGIYDKIVEKVKQNEVSFSGVTTYNLDEYAGLPADSDQSYAYYMNHHLFSHIDIPQNQTNLPDGNASDLLAACKQYDEMLEKQPIDIQLLGIGHNGHIGFNEPAEELQGGTHLVELKAETREANARFFASLDEVPTHALTMGVGSILKAKSVMLVARGADKAEILKKALKGPITTQVPASLLQTHPNVIVLVDREAGRWLA